jgi:8-oxo-dGTP pyrophosphatase MutT (NUDIX family)
VSIGHNAALLEIVSNHFQQLPSKQNLLKNIESLWSFDVDMTSRKTFPAHITASAILRRRDEVLMIKHKVLSAWLFPGGHIEPGEWPHEAAARELREETGYLSSPREGELIDVDCHVIPENLRKGEPEHFHIDFRYLFNTHRHEGDPDFSEICEIKWIASVSLPISYCRVAKMISQI